MQDKVKLVISTSWKPDRNEFLTALGISGGGFGEQCFGTVYDALFISSIEAKSEFKKYYAVEYAQFAEYLDIRYGRSLSEEELEADYVYIVTWLPEVIDNRYENNELKAVLKCIKKLERTKL